MRNIAILILFIFCLNSVIAQTETPQPPKPVKTKKYFLKDLNDLNSWDVGCHLGLTYPHTDISASGKRNLAFGLDVTKFFTHTVALQARIMHGKISGKDIYKSEYQFNTTITYDVSLNALFQFGNIAFLKHNPNIAIYGSIGVGVVNFSPEVSTDGGFVALPGVYSQYTQSLVVQDYESTTNLMVPVSVGFKYRVSEVVSVNAEYSYRKTNSDKLDGFYKLLSSDDNYSYFNVGFNYHMGGKSKMIEWVNPLQTLYTELNEMNSKIELFRKDTDMDGVADYFDREPETPAGNKVYGDGTTVVPDKEGAIRKIDVEPSAVTRINYDTTFKSNEELKLDVENKNVVNKEPVNIKPAELKPVIDSVSKVNPVNIEPVKKDDTLSLSKPVLSKPVPLLDSVSILKPKLTEPAINTNQFSNPNTTTSATITNNNTLSISSFNKKDPQKQLGLISSYESALLENYEDLPSIYFNISKNDIATRQFKTMEYIAMVMANNPQINFILLGLCDGSGNADFNFNLGLRRAESVRQYLISNFNINPERLATKTLGIVDIHLGANPLNRRVDIKVSK